MELHLRPWQMDDLPLLVKYANNPKVAANLMDRFPHPYTETDGRAFIKYSQENSPPSVLAICLNGEIVGGIGIHLQEDIFRKNAELGYWLGEPFWGKGITTRAVTLMLDYAFSQFDVDRIFARPFGRNVASQKVLEKAGFVLEAKFKKTIYKNGHYEDEWVYAIRKH